MLGTHLVVQLMEASLILRQFGAIGYGVQFAFDCHNATIALGQMQAQLLQSLLLAGNGRRLCLLVLCVERLQFTAVER